ncbi:MAG: hormogonium polysaccharide biosynthesis protein HpsA, partial [Cyanobacteria bacterium P01_D01_bin.50]
AGFPRDSNGDIQSSYFNNFATPVQRRALFPEYVMEICRKSTVTACKPDDWVVGYDASDNGKIDWTDSDEADIRAVDSGTSRIIPNDSAFTASRLGAGTTARPAITEDDRRYPRRVAFLRDAATGNLILDSNNQPIPLGISGSNNIDRENEIDTSTDDNGEVNYYPSDTYADNSTNRPRLHRRALWFKTTNSSSDKYSYKSPLLIQNFITNSNPSNQPLLIPVLQIHVALETPGNSNVLNTKASDVQSKDNNWLQVAVDTETNLVFAQGDTPARPEESNGGLENFPRYLEKWRNATHRASGSFIQYKRSAYATAPWEPILPTNYTNGLKGFSTTGTLFGYPQAYRTTINSESNTTLGRTPFYVQPGNRSWGFDVALLTQLPDLFSQRFTAPPTGDPNEFYREVSRDDSWVSTLLCAAQSQAQPGNYGTAPSNKYGSDKRYAIPENQRPSQCR